MRSPTAAGLPGHHGHWGWAGNVRWAGVLSVHVCSAGSNWRGDLLFVYAPGVAIRVGRCLPTATINPPARVRPSSLTHDGRRRWRGLGGANDTGAPRDGRISGGKVATCSSGALVDDPGDHPPPQVLPPPEIGLARGESRQRLDRERLSEPSPRRRRRFIYLAHMPPQPAPVYIPGTYAATASAGSYTRHRHRRNLQLLDEHQAIA